MKTNPLITALVCFGLWQMAAHAATKYWDIDGNTAAGAGGDAPSGTWNTGATPNWTTDSTGASAGTTWADGDDAVFSAGIDATNIFTVTLDNTASPPVQNAGNLTVEEGVLTLAADPGIFLNIGGGVAGKGIINIANGLTATISAELDSTYNSVGDDAGILWKTGTGRLNLSALNAFGATIVVAEGDLAAMVSNGALGSTLAPTIVSNGATVMVSVGGTGEPLNLNGQGFGGAGAMRCVSVANINYNGVVTLDSASRINSDTAQLSLFGFTADRNFDLTLGGNGSVRLNVNGGFKLGTGKLIKEGTGWAQTEGVSYTCSQVDFNNGIFRFRELPGQGFQDATQTGFVNFNIAADADEFRTVLANSITVANPIFLDATNLLMTLVSNSQITLSGVVSGASGGLAKGTNVASTLLLNNANTYGGNTTVQGGILALGASGSIANSPVIDVWANGIFNVTSNGSGITLGSAQTLKGDGIVWGNVTASGTVSPGSSIGTLSFSNNLTVSKLFIDVDKAVSPANDTMIVAGTLSAGSGTVTVTNLNPGVPLAPGDTFYLFKDDQGNNKAVTSGGSLVVSSAEGGVVWNNQLAVNGSIVVVSVTAPPVVQQPRITSIVGAGTASVTVNYTNTLAGTNYVVQYRTNLNTTNWTSLTPVPAAGSTSSSTDTPPAGDPHRFYRVYYVTQ